MLVFNVPENPMAAVQGPRDTWGQKIPNESKVELRRPGQSECTSKSTLANQSGGAEEPRRLLQSPKAQDHY